MIITGNCRVRMHYTLSLDSGEVIQSSFEGDPIEFEYGYGEIIPGLESELEGMGEGDEKKVLVSAENGYGLPDPSAVVNVPREDFPADGKLEPGMMFQLQSRDGHVMHARLVEADDNEVVLDMNHPLAGETLHFDVKIESVGESLGPPVSQGCGCGCGEGEDPGCDGC